jgi:transposase
MSIIAHTRSFVIGVDTHARQHVLAVMAAATGVLIATATFPTTTRGIARAIAWAARRTSGDLATLWAIEGTGIYGAGLARAVTQAGYQVIEAPHYQSGKRAAKPGKSDLLDAQRIAAAVLPLSPDELRHPRNDQGERAALQILITARDQMTNERTRHLNALTALLRTTDLGIDARRRLTTTKISQAARWRTHPSQPIAIATARAEATRLAQHILTLDTQIKDNQKHITTLVAATPAAGLTKEPGIGSITAAIAYTTWSHPGRVRSEAAYAALAGVNPIPASSGNTTRNRLNRGGDRRLNAALHMAIISRMTHDPTTRAYTNKRLAENHTTTRDIRRILKRYLARHIYRYLNTTTAAMTPLDKP